MIFFRERYTKFCKWLFNRAGSNIPDYCWEIFKVWNSVHLSRVIYISSSIPSTSVCPFACCLSMSLPIFSSEFRASNRRIPKNKIVNNFLFKKTNFIPYRHFRGSLRTSLRKERHPIVVPSPDTLTAALCAYHSNRTYCRPEEMEYFHRFSHAKFVHC